ncbi:DNA polymerase III subunit delta [Algicola sagamiensis]|uniref:DNA polymerase III subunit delta n=1 Tax=Algicola sagamiensis TaxID=163869 RepID=UPI000382DE57|nr:DNA polymerase III subunit delta [Algicola sagamiensis]
MRIFPNQLKGHLKQKHCGIYFVVGEEPFQRLEALDTIRQYWMAQGFHERIKIEASPDIPWAEVYHHASAMSLFSEKKIIEIALPDKKLKKETQDALLSLGEYTSPDTIFLCSKEKLLPEDNRSRWLKKIENEQLLITCYPQDGRGFAKWLAQKTQEYHLQCAPDLIQAIQTFYAGNLLAADQLLQQLSLIGHAGQYLSYEDAEPLLNHQSHFTAYQLVDIVLSGNSHSTLMMLKSLKKDHTEPTLITWALTRDLLLLSKLKVEYQSVGMVPWEKHGIWKKRQGAFRTAWSRLSEQNLQTLLDELQSFDISIKDDQLKHPFITLTQICIHCCTAKASQLKCPDDESILR